MSLPIIFGGGDLTQQAVFQARGGFNYRNQDQEPAMAYKSIGPASQSYQAYQAAQPVFKLSDPTSTWGTVPSKSTFELGNFCTSKPTFELQNFCTSLGAASSLHGQLAHDSVTSGSLGANLGAQAYCSMIGQTSQFNNGVNSAFGR